MPQRISLTCICIAPSHLWSDDSNAPADLLTPLERPHMPQRITSHLCRAPSHAPADQTHTFRVIIPMPQRIRLTPLSDDSNAPADHLTYLSGDSNAPADHLTPLSDNSNAPADHLTYLSEIQMPQRISLTPLSDDSNAPADQPHTSE